MTSILDFADAAALERDATPAVRAGLEDLRACGPGGTLLFPAGTYHFWPQRAEERYLFVSNNDESLARIAFPLFERDGLIIEGRGARFIFHGFMTPLLRGRPCPATGAGGDAAVGALRVRGRGGRRRVRRLAAADPPAGDAVRPVGDVGAAHGGAAGAAVAVGPVAVCHPV